MKRIKRAGAKRGAINTVKSGIALNELAIKGGADGEGESSDEQQQQSQSQSQSAITSRTARVLLAGAGFLADAVSGNSNLEKRELHYATRISSSALFPLFPPPLRQLILPPPPTPRPQYDLFVINLVLRLLRDEYPHYVDSGSLHALEGSVAAAALLGSIIGQLVAGSLADVLGRKSLFVATAALISIGSIGSAFCSDSEAFSIYGQIACWRFFLGAGVGGEYPLAATVTSESSSATSRGRLMAAVFAMQGVGALISVLIVLFCLGSGFSPGFSWRFSLAFGSVPAIVAFPWRLRMHETETFERVKNDRKLASALAAIDNNHFNGGGGGGVVAGGGGGGGSIYGAVPSSESNQGATTMASSALSAVAVRWAEIVDATRLYKWHMLGTASCWFLLDVVFYANGLFNHDVTSLILAKGRRTTASDDAWNSAFICAIGLPGYGLSFLFIDQVGRKNIQMMGFLAMGTMFCICGRFHDWFLMTDPGGDNNTTTGRQWLFLFLYSLTFLFSNFGPNTTTFVIPGEIYPAHVRATAHGLSAAAGKTGAAAGAYFFPLLLGPGGAAHPTSQGMRTAMILCGLVAFLGAVMTYLFIPRYGADELQDEDNYLELELACLQPSDETRGLLASTSHNEMIQMVELIDKMHIVDLGDEEEGEEGV